MPDRPMVAVALAEPFVYLRTLQEDRSKSAPSRLVISRNLFVPLLPSRYWLKIRPVPDQPLVTSTSRSTLLAPRVAVTVVRPSVPPAVTENVSESCPAGTRTDPGTLTKPLALRPTTLPPVGRAA